MRNLARLSPLLLLAACATAPPAAYSGEFTNARGEFVVCGDTRGWITGEYWRAPSGFERRAVFDRLAEERPDFVLNTGDLVSAGSSGSQWEVFDVETSALRANGIAYLPALGNHDLWPSKDGGLAKWFARFPFLHGRRWYDVRYGYVELIVVDSNESALSADETAEQAAWFRGRIAAADADATVRCVMVAMHHAPITNSVFHGSSAWARAQFVEPALASGKTKAFLTGHVHSYEHFVENGVHFLVSGGGGAPLMDVDGPTGANRDLYDGPRGHHFVRVIPRDDRIDFEIEMLDDERRWFRADAWSIGLP
jgi:3',5'-cyclic AMP phosphodiesterase CpdA